MHPNFLYGKILADGRPNFLTDYGFNFQNYGALGTNHSKCCATGSFANELNFGHLYTISKTEKEERTYDEPYTGDLPRRSWLCCPGSQARVETDQPPLLQEIKSPTTPVETITHPPSHIPANNGTCERLQLQLDEQAQRYEEQLTELHSVIAELTRKLHQQRTMAITEEDEVSESCTSAHEESITCPLEVSELEPLENDLSDLENKIPVRIVASIRLKRSTDRDVSPNDLLNTELSTAVAEHIVGDILRQCDAHTEKQSLDFEIRKANAKLEHARSQNTVLALTLNETKAHCDRLALLCGKYESNAIALRLALGITDRSIEAYDVLLALLETELSLSEDNCTTIENRTAAETVAKQLLSHLDHHLNSDVLLSPWQNHVYSTPIEINETWTGEHELRLREHVSRLKAERSNIQGTYVTLESTQVENVPIRPSSSQETRKMDLEMAVLMQELMGLREDKAELLSKLFALEKDKNALEIKLKYVEGQQKAQSATLKNLQGQLKDTEGLLALATQSKGVELELMQALAREARLKVRLQELVATLEQVTKNAEARLLEGREIVQDLNQTNSILADTVDRNTKKYQAKFKKMEHHMLNMVEKHTAQVQTLQQRIATLETPPTNSSENSLNSIPM
ncbi:hypothetical protein HUJ04_010629 [Dendroctonus ponderosae]|nr:hypothetical protein HUJ04_010629 [Dendroctonus ponderosae]